MKNCPKCNTENSDDARICIKCGYTFVTQTPLKEPKKDKKGFTEVEKKYDCKYTIKVFNGFLSFNKFFEDIEAKHEKSTCGGDYYDDVLAETIQNIKDAVRTGYEFYVGIPPRPTTYEELMSRNSYNRMDEFNKYYTDVIEPYAAQLLQDSKADLDMPVNVYNDRQLGFFDFTRASSGLFPKYAYYALKHRKFVDGNLVETYKEGKGYKYRLKEDGSPCVVLPILKDGQDEDLIHKACEEIYNGTPALKALKNLNLKLGGFASTIKKSYVYQEFKPKPKNAIRIFVYIGGSSDVKPDDLKWSGYLGVGLAKILELLGYSVSIYFVYGLGNYLYKDKKGDCRHGIRYFTFPLKKFQDPVDAANLLYVLSDNCFFRGKYFQYIVKLSQYYGDGINSNLGYTPSRQFAQDMTEDAIFSEFAKIDPLFINGVQNPECPFLYYVFGTVHSEQQFREKLRDTVLDIANKNRLAREKLGYQSLS